MLRLSPSRFIIGICRINRNIVSLRSLEENTYFWLSSVKAKHYIAICRWRKLYFTCGVNMSTFARLQRAKTLAERVYHPTLISMSCYLGSPKSIWQNSFRNLLLIPSFVISTRTVTNSRKVNFAPNFEMLVLYLLNVVTLVTCNRQICCLCCNVRLSKLRKRFHFLNLVETAFINYVDKNEQFNHYTQTTDSMISS